jgi:hypothetical protein
MGISQFGIHNYDKFWKNAENVRILADFNFQGAEINEELKEAIAVYLICKEGRMVIGFDKNAWSMFSFNPNTTDNQLLAVLPDQKIALIDQKTFQAMVPVLKTKAGLNHTFIMQAQPTNILTVADIDKALAYRG